MTGLVDKRAVTGSIRQQGFTLVEISIVLVIIALLTTSIIMGQKMIENARMKALIEQINTYQAAVYAFQTQYEYLPGDFPYASTTFDAPTGVTIYDGNGDGKVSWSESVEKTGTVFSNEGVNALQHLKLAGLLSGDPGSSKQTQIVALGGRITGLVHQGKTDIALVIKKLPTRYARRLDRELDDGSGETGRILNRNYNAYPTSDGGTVDHIVVRL